MLGDGPEYENEADRAEFELEFESWDDFTDFIRQYGTAFTAERIRVDEWIIQAAPHEAGRFQVAHNRYKGNRTKDEEVFGDG